LLGLSKQAIAPIERGTHRVMFRAVRRPLVSNRIRSSRRSASP
jgi:hypothetical protein